MLTINNLTVRLGGRTILDRASASLPPKSRTGLIGRNGAGKSTLMKAMIGELEADDGGIEMPRKTRLGYIAQEAPSGSATPFETVLAADAERADLLERSEIETDPDRLADIHERLIAIDAYTAPARAARILIGLGFDEDMQGRPLDSFSGGWKMRVALAALLFSNPDLLLLDEPSNHLDLEATMWLESFLRAYPGQLVVISHERDLLNNVVDHILHLEGGKVTLYAGGYDAFERQRAERAAQLAAAKAAQDAQRAKLQDYIARNSARASTAKQAQSRAKQLARMQPIAAIADDPSLVVGSLVQGALYLGLVGVPAWLVARRGVRWVDLGWWFAPEGRVREALQGLGIGVVAQVAAVPTLYAPILLLTDDLDVSGPARELVDRADGVGVVLLVLMVVVMAPLAEELFFRGLALRALEARMGPRTALVASAVLFGVTHLQLLQLPALVMIGLVCGWLAQRDGRLGRAVWAHVGFNLVTVAFLL